MPRKKKRAIEMTTDELMESVFPKKVRDQLKEAAKNARRYGEKPPHKGSVTED